MTQWQSELASFLQRGLKPRLGVGVHLKKNIEQSSLRYLRVKKNYKQRFKAPFTLMTEARNKLRWFPTCF